MKSSVKFIVGYLVAFFSYTGIYAPEAESYISTQDKLIANTEEITPLYLYRSSDLTHENDLLLYGHYSHQSHRSHYSHQSHSSHYSHRSSW